MEEEILHNICSHIVFPFPKDIVGILGKLNILSQRGRGRGRMSHLTRAKEQAWEDLATGNQESIHGALRDMITLGGVSQ